MPLRAEWTSTTLGAIADRDSGLVDGPFGSNLPASLYEPQGVPVIRGCNLTMGSSRFVAHDFVYVSESTAKTLARSICKPGDILFTKKGTIGQTGIVPYGGPHTRYLASSNQMRLRVDQSVADPGFVYYYVSSPAARAKIRRDSESTGVPKTNLTYLRTFPIQLPPLPEQRRIAGLLGALDDKIELNRRMNRTLESIARAIFKSWFVDFDPVHKKMEGKEGGEIGLPPDLATLFPASFEPSELGPIPRGFQVRPLGELFELGVGGAWGEDAPGGTDDVAVRCLRGIDLHDLSEGRIPDAPVRYLSAGQLAKRQLSAPTLLVEGSGSFCGRSFLVIPELLGFHREATAYSNFCKRLDPKCSRSVAVVAWMQLQRSYRGGDVSSYRTGTAFPNLDIRSLLDTLRVVIPSEPLAEAFESIFLATRGDGLARESRTEALLRDVLLPYLLERPPSASETPVQAGAGT